MKAALPKLRSELEQDMKATYSAKGYVYGNLWGSGTGAYPARKLEAPTKKKLVEQARAALENGSLDSGMGFESLIGAILEIKKTIAVEVKGKWYTRYEYSTVFLGNLTRKQKAFLKECLFFQ